VLDLVSARYLNTLPLSRTPQNLSRISTLCDLLLKKNYFYRKEIIFIKKKLFLQKRNYLKRISNQEFINEVNLPVLDSAYISDFINMNLINTVNV